MVVFDVGLGDGGEDVGVVDEDLFGGLEDFAGEVAQRLVDQQAEAADDDGGDEGEAEEGDAHGLIAECGFWNADWFTREGRSLGRGGFRWGRSRGRGRGFWSGRI